MLPKPQDNQEWAIRAIFETYASISFRPSQKQYTVLASFYLTKHNPYNADSDSPQPLVKIISLSTGTKCMPAAKYSPRGEMIHDSHAEVLARRGAVRWCIEEIGRIKTASGYTSEWLARNDDSFAGDSDEKVPYRLQDGVELNMYVSTLPCGDVSMRYLASIQDAAMATLKSTNVFPALASDQASRGRDNYNRLGVLRTKPGRADSPPALSMSCSDKIARWVVLGIQGALASRLLEPLYMTRIVIGEVPSEIRAREMVREDCERGFWTRVKDVKGLPVGYAACPPEIHFTDTPFSHCKTELDKSASTTGSCNESLCWIADSQPAEVLINGLKRSTPTKKRYLEKYRPILSHLAMFKLQHEILKLEGLTPAPRVPYLSVMWQPPFTTQVPFRDDDDLRYADAKSVSARYQAAKAALIGINGPLSGWIRIDPCYQEFTIGGG